MVLDPLEGFVVGVTADRRWQEQAELLRRRGATIVHGPSIATMYLADDEELRRATLDVIARPPDYLVATTGIGIRAWFETAASWGLGDDLVGALRPARVAARGPKSAGAVQGVGLDVWVKSATEQMDDLLPMLFAEDLKGARVAFQQHGAETPSFTGALVDAGATVVEVPVYRWRLPEDVGPAAVLIEGACEGRVDAVTFTSAPAVRNLFEIAAQRDMAGDLLRAFNTHLIAACVGPVCAEGAREAGIESPLQPSVGRLGLLVRALSDALAPRRRVFRSEYGELTVQGSAFVLDGDGAEGAGMLSGRERSVFDELAAAPGVVLSRTTLLERVWGSADVDEHLLEVTVGRLRRRLGPFGPAIEAKPGRGYRLASG